VAKRSAGIVDVVGAQPAVKSLKYEWIVDTVYVLPGEMIEAFDGYSEYVTRLEEIRPVMECSLDSGRASLIKVVMDCGTALGVWLARSAEASEVLSVSTTPCISSSLVGGGAGGMLDLSS